MTVVEIGAGETPDARADVTVDLRAVCDVQATATRLPMQDDSCEMLLAHHVIEHIDDLEPVIQEFRRVVKPNGIIEIRVPLGLNAANDYTHAHTDWTPEKLKSLANPKPWQNGIGLDVVEINVHGWLFGPLRVFSPVFEWLSNHYPEWVAYRAGGGEIVATYRVNTD